VVIIPKSWTHSSKILNDKCAPRALRATTQGVVLLQSRSAGNATPNADEAKQNYILREEKDLLCLGSFFKTAGIWYPP